MRSMQWQLGMLGTISAYFLCSIFLKLFLIKFLISLFCACCFVCLCRLLPFSCFCTATITFYSEVLIGNSAVRNSKSLSWNRVWLSQMLGLQLIMAADPVCQPYVSLTDGNYWQIHLIQIYEPQHRSACGDTAREMDDPGFESHQWPEVFTFFSRPNLLRSPHSTGRGKAVPLQAWTGPEGSRKLGSQIS